MIAKSELQAWLNNLPPNDVIGIDDGGLALVSMHYGAHLEVGGIPEPSES